MKISVVVAAYCGEKFIGEQIESLLKQTKVPDEIIITDDSPDDRTRTVLTPFFSDPRIHYYYNGKQLGVNRNFEKALSLCSGDIIFLCDQDDVWLPEKIETMVDVLEKNPACDGVFCDSCVVWEDLKPQGFSLWQMRMFTRWMQKKFASGKQLEVFLKRVTCSTHNIAIRRTILKTALPFPELDPFFTDTFLGLLISVFGKWAMVSRELTLYRVHSGNLSAPKLANIMEQAELFRRARQKHALVRNMELADDLLRYLPPDTPADKLEKIAGFRKHHAVRNGYSRLFFIRIWQVACEIFSLRYSRYSNGWKSIAADLFLI